MGQVCRFSTNFNFFFRSANFEDPTSISEVFKTDQRLFNLKMNKLKNVPTGQVIIFS